MIRFWLKYLLAWAICSTLSATFMVSPFWLYKWTAPTSLYVASAVIGLLFASFVMSVLEYDA